MAVLWALPYVLITAELASAIPKEGGAYQWYRSFLSPFWAFQFSCLDWLTWILDAALYPPLLAAYFLGFVMEMGALGVWLGFPVGFAARAALESRAFSGSRWTRTGVHV